MYHDSRFLALTASLSYLSVAGTAIVYSDWPTAIVSASLAGTSIWFHTTRTPASFWADQIAILGYVGQGLAASWTRGLLPFLGVVSAVGYACGVYYGGRQWQALAFGPSTHLWHASIHALSGAAGLFYLFSPPQDKCDGIRSTSPCSS